MTCRVLVRAPDGSPIVSRALLNPGSSASFVSERLTQSLCLPRLNHGVRIMGIGGLSHESPTRTLTKFVVSPTQEQTMEVDVTAVIMPRVTCDLPLQPIPFKPEWTHLSDLTLADPDFGVPGRIDLLLGIDVFTQIIRQGRRTGVPGSPSAFETTFGWVLAGETNVCMSNISVVFCHASSVISGDQILQRFWEIEEPTSYPSGLSPEERMVVQHFQENHQRTESGRFLVPLPKKPHCKPLGESRSQAVRRYLSLERSLQSKNRFGEFSSVMEEYFEQGHAELVPTPDPPDASKSLSLLRWWHLCQGILKHFWKSSEYLVSLRKSHKWHQRSGNLAVGDVALIQENGFVLTKWPLARVTEVYPGKDNVVRVVQVKTSAGIYTRPVSKVACILPFEH